MVDDSGIIKSIEQINAHHSHVISDPTNSTSGALRVQTESPGLIEQIAALTTELEQVTCRIVGLELELNAASMEIALLKSALDKQLWRENCILQLKHEDEIDSKEEIQSLKACLHRPLQTPTLKSMEELSISSYDSDNSSMYSDHRDYQRSQQGMV